LARAELDRIASGQPSTPFVPHADALLPPVQSSSSSAATEADVQKWRAAVKSAETQVEYGSIQYVCSLITFMFKPGQSENLILFVHPPFVHSLENLELLKRYGANAWQVYNKDAEAADKG
jgi:hypothetical protein